MLAACSAGGDPQARRLDPHHAHPGILEKRMEQPHGIGAAADTGQQQVGEPPFGFEELGARLAADHRLEIAHQHRVGVRAGHRADDVEGVAHVGHPVAQGLVHGILEGGGAAGHRVDPGAEQLHAEDVQRLAADVLLPHEDVALHAEQGGDRGGGHAVLAGAGLGNHLALAHAPGQQRLADGVVDLVRPGVVEILALEVDLRAAGMLGQAFRQIERARPADVLAQVAVELAVESGSAWAAR